MATNLVLLHSLHDLVISPIELHNAFLVHPSDLVSILCLHRLAIHFDVYAGKLCQVLRSHQLFRYPHSENLV